MWIIFSENDLIEIFFKKFGLDWHIYKNGYKTDTYEQNWVSSN